MLLTIIGLCLTLLWISSYLLVESHWIGNDNFILVLGLLFWGFALICFWIALLVIAFRNRQKMIRRILLGSAVFGAVLVIGIVFLVPEKAPIAWRVHASRSSLDAFVRTVPEGWSETPRKVGSFPVRRFGREKDTVWLDCWDAFLGINGLAYHVGGTPPKQSRSQYWHLEGPWYFWYEDHF